MATKEIVHVSSHVGRDEDGNTYQIDKFQDIHISGKSRVDGWPSITLDGEPCQYVSRGKYKTAEGIEVTSDDPTAP